MKKLFSNLPIVLGIIILLSSTAIAFAVSAPSMSKDSNGNNALYLLPGEKEGLTFTLQNGGGATDPIEVKSSIIEGSEVIVLNGESTFVIPAGGRQEINALVSIPSEANIGDIYSIALAFDVSGTPGSFTFGSRIQQKFNVIIGEEPKPVVASPESEPQTQLSNSKTNMILIIASILVIIAIILFFFLRKKRV